MPVDDSTARARSGRPIRGRKVTACERCGETFEQYHSDCRRFCSRLCANRTSIEARAERPRQLRLALKPPAVSQNSYRGEPKSGHISKACRRCGQTFSGPPSIMALRKSCSRACAKNRVTKTCPRCGKTFEKPASQAKLFVHCSKECQKRPNRIECEGCGNGFSRPDCTAGSARFCSNSCRLGWFANNFRGDVSPHWQGGLRNYYGPSWKPARRIVRRRDNHTCQHCGKTREQMGEEPAVAHVVAFRTFGVERHEEANRPDNLICLCRSCHAVFDWNNGTRT